jgi:hypothetical protein
MAPRKHFEPVKFEPTEFCNELLADMRKSLEPHRLYGRDPKVGDELAAAVLDPALAGAPIPLGLKLEYRWFLRELVRVFRTRSGPELAMQAELVLQKWHGFGLKVEMMQWLLGAVWSRVKAEGPAE